MYLKELIYIVTIADVGSISHAAESLCMAQSSLSEFLQQYEAELGTRLFIRTSAGVRPTSQGRLFVYNARQMLLHYRRVKNEISDIENLKGGTIELGVSTFRGTYLIPGVLRKFYDQYPDIRVNIHEENSMALEQQILDGRLDLALVALPLVKLKMAADYLLKDEICIVAAKSHPIMQFAQKSDKSPWRCWIDLKDVEQFEFILSAHDTILGRRGRKVFEEAGIRPMICNDNITASFACAMAVKGLGLAFTYRSSITDRGANCLSIGKNGEYLDLALVSPEGYQSKAARALRQVFHTYFQEEGFRD